MTFKAPEDQGCSSKVIVLTAVPQNHTSLQERSDSGPLHGIVCQKQISTRYFPGSLPFIFCWCLLTCYLVSENLPDNIAQNSKPSPLLPSPTIVLPALLFCALLRGTCHVMYYIFYLFICVFLNASLHYSISYRTGEIVEWLSLFCRWWLKHCLTHCRCSFNI